MNAYHDYVTYDDIVKHWASERPDGPALEMDGRVCNFSELDQSTRRLIGFFQSRGLVKGDRIAWLGKNSDLYCQLYIAAARMVSIFYVYLCPAKHLVCGEGGSRLLTLH